MKVNHMWECENDCLRLKREGHSNKLTFFCFCPWQVNIQLYHSPKFQPLKCLLSWRNSSWKERLWGPPFWKCTWKLGCVYVVLFRLTWICGEEKNLQLSWCSFFQVSIHFTIFTAIIFEACLAPNNMAQEQP